MKRYLTLCVFWGLAVTLHAQDSLQHRLQIGLELLKVNAVQPYGFKSRNLLQPLSGIMVRYHLQRWAIRAGANFSRDVTQSDNRNCYDCSSWELHGYDYGFRAGAQYTLPKKREWLYAFVDLYYRHYQGEGRAFNPWVRRGSPEFKHTQTGIGAQVGLGLQIKIYRGLSILTEVSFANERLSFINLYRLYGGGYGAYRGHLASVLSPGASVYLMARF